MVAPFVTLAFTEFNAMLATQIAQQSASFEAITAKAA